MAVKEEKTKVGRPKLADKELIKDSWCRIGASLAIVLVLVVCGVGMLTTRTPFQVLTFQNPADMQGNVINVKNNSNTRIIYPTSVKRVRVIPAKKTIKRVIDANGNVTRIITPDSVVR